MIEDYEFVEFDTKSREHIQAEIENFDEDEDIILPDSIFGEIVYIFYILRDIFKNRKTASRQWFLLKRQVRMFKLWRKNNYGR